MRKFLALDDFRKLTETERHSDDGLIRTAVSSMEVLKAADGTDSRVIRFCFSDGTVDLAGDTIAAEGWDLGDFKANPVALWAHDSYSPPIGKAANVGPSGGRLMGDIEFAAAEIYPFADTIYRLYKGGFLNAVSVGFIPLEWSYVSDPTRPYGIDFKRQKLLEISCCPVPCNPNALLEARSAGIDVAPLTLWARETLVRLQKEAPADPNTVRPIDEAVAAAAAETAAALEIRKRKLRVLALGA